MKTISTSRKKSLDILFRSPPFAENQITKKTAKFTLWGVPNKNRAPLRRSNQWPFSELFFCLKNSVKIELNVVTVGCDGDVTPGGGGDGGGRGEGMEIKVGEREFIGFQVVVEEVKRVRNGVNVDVVIGVIVDVVVIAGIAVIVIGTIGAILTWRGGLGSRGGGGGGSGGSVEFGSVNGNRDSTAVIHCYLGKRHSSITIALD